MRTWNHRVVVVDGVQDIYEVSYDKDGHPMSFDDCFPQDLNDKAIEFAMRVPVLYWPRSFKRTNRMSIGEVLTFDSVDDLFNRLHTIK